MFSIPLSVSISRIKRHFVFHIFTVAISIMAASEHDKVVDCMLIIFV